MKRIIVFVVTLGLLFSTLTIVSAGVDVSDYELIKTITLKLNETEQLSLKDSEGKLIPATWTSSDTSIATVDSEGNVNPQKVGTVYMLTILDGKKYSVKVIVNPSEVTTEQEGETKPEVISGYEVIMTTSIKLNETGVVQIGDSEGEPISVTWTSSDTSIATVDAKGNVTPKKVGTVYMLTTWEGNKYCAKVIITPKETTTESSTATPKETTKPGATNSNEVVTIVVKEKKTEVKEVRIKTKKITVNLPGAVKIKKAVNKKKSAKKIKITIVKIKGVNGYHVCIYKNKANAGMNKNAIVSKVIKKNVGTFVLKNKKIKNQQKLFVRIRAYKAVNGKAYYGAWSKVTNVKMK